MCQIMPHCHDNPMTASDLRCLFGISNSILGYRISAKSLIANESPVSPVPLAVTEIVY